MACKINNFIVDKITRIVAFNSNDDVLFAINQAQNPQISVTSDEISANDNTGSPIVTFNRAKQCTFSVENAIFDLSLHAVQAGMADGKIQAAASAKIEVPHFEEVSYTGAATIQLQKKPRDTASVKLYVLNGDGSFGTSFKLDTTATENTFAVSSEGQLSFPTSGVNVGDRLIVVYTYEADGTDGNGAVTIINSAKNFPKACKLVVEAIGVEACTPDENVFLYIVFPNFKPSSNFDYTMSTDSVMSFEGTAQQDYCDPDKVLYRIICPC